MKNYFFLFLMAISLFSCKDDEKLITPLSIGCLQDLPLLEENTSCDSSGSFLNCELTPSPLTKQLSTTLKTTFVDFCNEVNDELVFKNATGQCMLAKITDKKYQSSASIFISGNIFTNPNSPSPQTDSCQINCLAGELAYIDFFSETFSFRVGLTTSIQANLFDVDNPASAIRSGFNVWTKIHPSFTPYTPIFSVDLEDYLDNSIFPDTTYARYHEDIILNNTSYSGLFSNENYNLTQSAVVFTNPDTIAIPREKIYFHPEDGLIAVRDSLGELWVRD